MQPLMPASRPVLVCYDGSAHSRHGLRAAQELPASVDIVVLAVWQSVATKLAEGGSFGVIALSDHEALDETEEQAARSAAMEAAECARTAGHQATARIEEAGEPIWSKILQVADDLAPAFIVTGSCGRGPLKSALLGSVSQEILSHSTRPVLIVPPEAGEKP